MTGNCRAGSKRKTPGDEADSDLRDPRDPRNPGPPLLGGLRSRQPDPGRLGPPDPGVSADDYFRHLYDTEPDFVQLAKQDPDFKAVLQPNGHLDFTNPAATMQLTKTLLQADFGLKIDLPDDRLCPPVPNRHNYILWLKDLMDTTSYEPPGRPLCGLDVGTGASCIYPLLGTRQRPWSFVATDVDDKNLSYAQRNIRLNGLESRIHLVPRNPDDPLIPLDHPSVKQTPIDFVMMNPPFYASPEEMMSSAQQKSRPPMSACTGAPVEMVCSGGELAHVGRLLRESLDLRDKVRWYTTMLGKLSSLEALVEQLREQGVDNYAVTEFVQGRKTRRWALGWSFGPMRPAEHAARGMKAAVWKKLLPPATATDLLELPVDAPVEPVIARIHEAVGGLELISWSWDAGAARGLGRASENVWSRAWRRKRLREPLQQGQGGVQDASPSQHPAECRLGFEIRVVMGKVKTSVDLHWREGHDPLLFESFGGFLSTKLKENK
ncbi:hypothetical protein VTJ83DRAFT_5140 [Remersonia thermophila]|uniref:U6 small nuclear RNA (adenine-(43)-N(6))-methyltransferase n=1 Tax=Remersonia thermophila TaxID=72144 RepID=A0ABR4DBY5_9PEZI